MDGAEARLTLDDVLEKFGHMTLAERASQWAVGDLILEAIETAKTQGIPKKHAVGRLAETGHCSAAHIRQRAAINEAFNGESRNGFVNFSLLRACLGAAKRTGREPADILREALSANWHAADVNLLGRENPEVFTLSAECGGCGAKWTGRASFRSGALPCPYCTVRAREDGVSEVAEIGALRAV